MQLQTTCSESKFPDEYIGVIFIQIDQHLKKLFKKYKGFPIFWNTVYTCQLCACSQQHCAHCKATLFTLIRGRFWGFFVPQRRHLALFGVKFAWRSAPLLFAKFHPHQCNDKGIGPPKWKFTKIVRNFWRKILKGYALQGHISCAIFTQFAKFVHCFRMHQLLKFRWICSGVTELWGF